MGCCEIRGRAAEDDEYVGPDLSIDSVRFTLFSQQTMMMRDVDFAISRRVPGQDPPELANAIIESTNSASSIRYRSRSRPGTAYCPQRVAFKPPSSGSEKKDTALPALRCVGRYPTLRRECCTFFAIPYASRRHSRSKAKQEEGVMAEGYVRPSVCFVDG